MSASKYELKFYRNGQLVAQYDWKFDTDEFEDGKAEIIGQAAQVIEEAIDCNESEAG